MCAIKTSQNELYGKYPCWRCLRKYTNVHSMNVNVVVCFLSAFFALKHSLDLWVHPTDRHEVITHFFTLPVSIMHYSKYSMERRPTCKCNARLLTIHIIWFDRFDEFSTSAIFVRLSTLGFYEFDQRNFHLCSSNRLILLNHGWTGDFGLSVNWNRVERNYRKFDSFGRNQVKPILNSCNPCNS